MQRGKLLGIVCAIAMVAGLLFAGCACEGPPTEGPPTEGPPTEGPPTEGPPTEGPPEVYELSMQTPHPPDDTMNTVVMQSWFNWLEEESGGRLKFTLYTMGQVAAAADIYDAVRTGIVDMGCQMDWYLPDRFPLISFNDMPFIYDTPCGYQASMTISTIYEDYPQLQAELSDVKFLHFHCTGSEMIVMASKPVHTPADLKGQVLTSGAAFTPRALTLLGASPVVQDPTEFYDALAKGVVDGNASTPWTAVPVFHFQDVIKYAVEVPLGVTTFLHVMNLDTWNSLPADLQALFEESYWYMPQVLGYRFDVTDAEGRQLVEDKFAAEGLPPIYVPTEAELEEWREAVLPIHEEWVAQADALGAPGGDILEAVQRYKEQYRYEDTPVDEIEAMLHEWGAPGY